ncbi:hypothetical protein A3A39_00185 [Candidatus Kaiserbacteria bacterium RIFCSPLOWO2_01_FULL_54_13]|uniref:Uncharacterized protein n=1 Tax=Candidatus Kaiserbacteria bacterium RIFCSPLOWO2_01_FULL_54_13 TaxID=1798512 RepID=A0A1F6F3P0_9BACT|nr:MAG: hypothetical protein A3A39_00185 [Candidatus Kaiserbacteria bacterium RIFCSPLOWO2_01_FULL_54_13]
MITRLVGTTHLVAGDTESIAGVLSFLKREGIETHGNPDLYVRTYRQFGIDEARELRERASLRPVGQGRVFVVATPGMTHEAQNALLKTLEEPPANALFFFIVPSPETLLPTLRSRASAADFVSPTDLRSPSICILDFLKSPPKGRLDMLKPLLEKGEDERRDLGAILAFLSALERHLEKHPESLRALYRARKYIADRGALVKPLLEQVALLVPRL